MSFFDDEDNIPESPSKLILPESDFTDFNVTVSAQSRTWFDDVLAFVTRDVGVKNIPEVIVWDSALVERYWKLLDEELGEMMEGHRERNPVKFADGLADTMFVLMALSVVSGIDQRPVWSEVVRSNLEKLGGPRREDGKLMKPPGWRPPQIAQALTQGRLK